MPKCLPKIVRNHLDKACAAALAAVEAYNRSGPRFRTAHYIVVLDSSGIGVAYPNPLPAPMMTRKARKIHQRVEVKQARMNPRLKPMDLATETLNGPSLPWSRPPTTKEIPSTIHG